MTIYAKAPASVPVRYITPGKKYPVTECDDRGFETRCDRGRVMYCLWKGCAHLDGGNWERDEQ